MTEKDTKEEIATLRDQFAMAALAAFSELAYEKRLSNKYMANLAYEIADEMMKRRNDNDS